jgi:putative redox protein
MVMMTVKALTNLSCEAVHEPSAATMITDAPQDVGGSATSFSPTDLIGTALLTCILTTMGLVANKLEIDLSGSYGTVEKTMGDTKPRRIATVNIILNMMVAVSDAEIREKLERAAHNCPVHHSLHPDIDMNIQINWAV